MLSLLLDENISQDVAEQILEKCSDIRVESVHYWHGGMYKGQPDEIILLKSVEEGLTLVTYDKGSIIRILKKLGSAGTDHSGVLFVDRRTIEPSDYGSLVRSIIAFWDRRKHEVWTNMTDFLLKPQ